MLLQNQNHLSRGYNLLWFEARPPGGLPESGTHDVPVIREPLAHLTPTWMRPFT